MVSGVQGSLQSLFGMFSYVVALAFSDLTAFPWLMAASCTVVVTGEAYFVMLSVMSCTTQLNTGVRRIALLTGFHSLCFQR